jgi:anti-sigma regulatory factor (Ser/Thr protein kinase)
MRTATFPGEYKSLKKISEFVVQAARQAGLNEHATYQVDLAVDEACCNIIDHAYGGEGLGEMTCSVEINSDRLTVIIKDHGRPFDPSKVPEPKLDAPLEQVKRRGAGFYLMRKIMDELHYEHIPEEGNVLMLVKKK